MTPRGGVMDYDLMSRTMMKLYIHACTQRQTPSFPANGKGRSNAIANAQRTRPILPVTDPTLAVVCRPCPAKTDNLQMTVRVLAHLAQGSGACHHGRVAQ